MKKVLLISEFRRVVKGLTMVKSNNYFVKTIKRYRKQTPNSSNDESLPKFLIESKLMQSFKARRVTFDTFSIDNEDMMPRKCDIYKKKIIFFFKTIDKLLFFNYKITFKTSRCVITLKFKLSIDERLLYEISSSINDVASFQLRLNDGPSRLCAN
jgi:hypothetical protein